MHDRLTNLEPFSTGTIKVDLIDVQPFSKSSIYNTLFSVFIYIVVEQLFGGARLRWYYIFI